MSLSSQPPVAAKPLLLVANQHDRTLSIIDADAGTQIAAVPEDGITGHEVAASPDGRTAYVPIYGNSGVGKPGTDGNEMVVIDIASQKVIHRVDFGHGVRPHAAIYDKHSGMVYVTTELDKAITIVDPKTLQIVGKIPTGQDESHMFVFSKDGSKAYTANVGPGTVSVLDIKGRKVIGTIPISKTTQRISISRDGKTVFTADQVKPRLAMIDTATDKVRGWIDLPALGYGTASTMDGHYLLVGSEAVKQVMVVDLKTNKVVHTIDTPGFPTEILVRPNGKVAYASCGSSHNVAEIDLSQWKIDKLIAAGDGADGLAWVE